MQAVKASGRIGLADGGVGQGDGAAVMVSRQCSGRGRTAGITSAAVPVLLPARVGMSQIS